MAPTDLLAATQPLTCHNYIYRREERPDYRGHRGHRSAPKTQNPAGALYQRKWANALFAWAIL